MSDESKRAAEGIVALIEAAYADRIADLLGSAEIGLRYALLARAALSGGDLAGGGVTR